MHKYETLKQNKAAFLPFSKLSNFFNLSMSMDKKGPLQMQFSDQVKPLPTIFLKKY